MLHDFDSVLTLLLHSDNIGLTVVYFMWVCYTEDCECLCDYVCIL